MSEIEIEDKRNFGLIDENGNEIGVFTGKKPRDAALKVASRGYTDIILREKGAKKLHYFKGSRKLIPCPPTAPKGMVENAANGKIYKANVKKLGIAKLQYHVLAKNDKSLFRMPLDNML